LVELFVAVLVFPGEFAVTLCKLSKRFRHWCLFGAVAVEHARGEAFELRLDFAHDCCGGAPIGGTKVVLGIPFSVAKVFAAMALAAVVVVVAVVAVALAAVIVVAVVAAAVVLSSGPAPVIVVGVFAGLSHHCELRFARMSCVAPSVNSVSESWVL
jgi:hypothetical protein